MTNELADKAHEVRILELELQKLELDARIKQLKAEPTIEGSCCIRGTKMSVTDQDIRDKEMEVELLKLQIDEQKFMKLLAKYKYSDAYFIDSLKKQLAENKRSDTLIWQNRLVEKNVFIVEQQIIIKQLQDEFAEKQKLTIDEECVGCCKVVDVAANLQHELDEYKETLRVERIDRECEITALNRKHHKDHKTTIEELKDKNIEDLKELYDLCEEELRRLKYVISARDLTIKSLTSMCQSSGTERNKLTSTIEDLRTRNQELTDHIDSLYGIANRLEVAKNGLEAELSARKGDSEVLLKVVDTIRCWESTPIGGLAAVTEIKDIIDDYLDAPEGPPSEPVCSFCDMECVKGQADVDKPQEVTIGVFLELP